MASEPHDHQVNLARSATNYDHNPAYGVTPRSAHDLPPTERGQTAANIDIADQNTNGVGLNSVPQPLPPVPATTTESHYDYPYPEAAAAMNSESTVPPPVAPPSYQVSIGDNLGFSPPVKPDYPGAHSFVVLAATVTITCAIFNPLSLFFGIPALVLAIVTLKYKYKSEDYPRAKFYGRCSFIFSLITVGFTLGCILLIISSTTGGLYMCRYISISRNSDPRCETS